ncbi:MAG: PhzF family phenazine biosynthesis protein [Gemmatimonadaceae bacterium]
MTRVLFETVDVFTDRRFGGNQLAVVLDARGLSDGEMQSLAAEFNLSETTFVLPPAEATHTARVRIFNRTAEMPFAGHPNVGTACVLAWRGLGVGDAMTFEGAAGLVHVRLRRGSDGQVNGATVTAPRLLSLGTEIPAAEVAGCVGIAAEDVIVSAHQPVLASVGNTYIIAEVSGDALTRATPDVAAFRRAVAARPMLGGRYSLHLYARGDGPVRARMFAPLAGTYEDPATGSANAPLGALLLSLTREERYELEVVQGVEMGRPSRLYVTAWREGDGIRATVGGTCVPVMKGEAIVGD